MMSRTDETIRGSRRRPTFLTGRRPRRDGGLTLLEVLLSIALLGVLLAMLFVFAETTMRTEQEGTDLATQSQLARVVLDRIANEIRQATAFGTSISGDKNSIRVLTTALPDKEIFEKRKVQDKPLAASYDLLEVRYYLKIYEDEYVELDDGEEVPAVAGLYRREWKILGHENRKSLTEGMNALPQAVKITVGYKEIALEPVYEKEDTNVIDLNPGVEEAFAPEIKCIKFAYHDGKNWVNTWAFHEDEEDPNQTDATGADTQSQSQILYDDEDEDEKTFHPDRYTVVVRLYQSDPTGLGSKLVRINDEIQEQFGGMGGGDALSGLMDLSGGGGTGDLTSALKGLGGLGNLGNLAGQAGQMGGMANQLGNLQNLMGGGSGTNRFNSGSSSGGQSDGSSAPAQSSTGRKNRFSRK